MSRVLLSQTAISLQQRLLHREYWIGIILDRGLPILVPLLAWMSIFNYAKLNVLEGWTASEMGGYYVLAIFIATLSNTEFHRDISDMVHRGTLDQWLVRPLTFFQLSAGVILSRFLILLIPSSIILLISYFVAPTLPIFTLHAFLTGLVVLPLAILIFALLTTVVGLVSFWTVQIHATFALIMVILDFLGGLMLPLSLLPTFLQSLSAYLPLRFAISDPISAMLSSGTNLLPIVCGQLLWCTLLFLLASLLWTRGVRLYEAAGG